MNLIQLRRINPTRSVGVKLFLIFLAAIVFVVLLLGLLSYSKAKSTIKHNVAEANHQTMIQTSEKLDILLKQYESLPLQLFMDPEVIQQLKNLQQATTEYDKLLVNDSIGKKLSSKTNADVNVTAMALVPEEANLPAISSGNFSFQVEESRNEDWFKSAVANSQSYQPWYTHEVKNSQSYWFLLPNSDGTDHISITMARFFKISEEDSGYTVLMQLGAGTLESAFASVTLGDHSQIQLVAADGTVIAASTPVDSGKTSKYPFIKNSKTDTTSLDTIDTNGNPVLAVFSPLKQADWKLTGIIPTEALIKDARPILINTFIIAAGAALLAILMGIWMVQTIARPLAKLKTLMAMGAKGDLSVRTAITSKDEIGQLSASFNTMMEQITELVGETSLTAQEMTSTAGELSDVSTKTAIAAQEIAAATEEIAGGAGTLAQEAERGNHLTDTITHRIETVIDTNKEMETSAHNIYASSELGALQLKDLMAQTSSTSEMTKELVAKINTLKEATSSVMKVLDMMRKITQQTHILSLNARIEAARAGEAGRGFMTVAAEVGLLAEQSHQSIAMVADIANTIMNEMNNTFTVLSNITPLFQQQNISVKTTGELFMSVQEEMGAFIQKLSSVTLSIDSLSQSQTHLTDTMGNVSAVAEQSSATSQQVASLCGEQRHISDYLVALSIKLEGTSDKLQAKLSSFTL